MKDFLSFDTMLAPKLIVLLYWLGLLGVLGAGVTAIFAGQILYGVLTIVFGVLAVRVACEVWIVFFKINEALQEIRKK